MHKQSKSFVQLRSPATADRAKHKVGSSSVRPDHHCGDGLVGSVELVVSKLNQQFNLFVCVMHCDFKL